MYQRLALGVKAQAQIATPDDFTKAFDFTICGCVHSAHPRLVWGARMLRLPVLRPELANLPVPFRCLALQMPFLTTVLSTLRQVQRMILLNGTL